MNVNAEKYRKLIHSNL